MLVSSSAQTRRVVTPSSSVMDHIESLSLSHHHHSLSTVSSFHGRNGMATAENRITVVDRLNETGANFTTHSNLMMMEDHPDELSDEDEDWYEQQSTVGATTRHGSADTSLSENSTNPQVSANESMASAPPDEFAIIARGQRRSGPIIFSPDVHDTPLLLSRARLNVMSAKSAKVEAACRRLLLPTRTSPRKKLTLLDATSSSCFKNTEQDTSCQEAYQNKTEQVKSKRNLNSMLLDGDCKASIDESLKLSLKIEDKINELETTVKTTPLLQREFTPQNTAKKSSSSSTGRGGCNSSHKKRYKRQFISPMVHHKKGRSRILTPAAASVVQEDQFIANVSNGILASETPSSTTSSVESRRAVLTEQLSCLNRAQMLEMFDTMMNAELKKDCVRVFDNENSENNVLRGVSYSTFVLHAIENAMNEVKSNNAKVDNDFQSNEKNVLNERLFTL